MGHIRIFLNQHSQAGVLPFFERNGIFSSKKLVTSFAPSYKVRRCLVSPLKPPPHPPFTRNADVCDATRRKMALKPPWTKPWLQLPPPQRVLWLGSGLGLSVGGRSTEGGPQDRVVPSPLSSEPPPKSVLPWRWLSNSSRGVRAPATRLSGQLPHPVHTTLPPDSTLLASVGKLDLKLLPQSGAALPPGGKTLLTSLGVGVTTSNRSAVGLQVRTHSPPWPTRASMTRMMMESHCCPPSEKGFVCVLVRRADHCMLHVLVWEHLTR